MQNKIIPMPAIKRHFRASQDADEGLMPPVILGHGDAFLAEDEETSAAFAYLEYVKNQAANLPFATELSVAEEERVPFPVATATVPPAVGFELKSAIIEYYKSLRELVSNSLEKQEIVLDFSSSSSEELGMCDYASIVCGIEELADVADEMEVDVVAEWLFGLLVYLDFPILEDTAAALQVLRRFCLSQYTLGKPKLFISSVIISEYFRQI